MTEVFVKRGLQKCKLWRVETEFADCYCCISGPSSSCFTMIQFGQNSSKSQR